MFNRHLNLRPKIARLVSYSVALLPYIEQVTEMIEYSPVTRVP